MTVKRTFQIAILSIFGTSAAIAIGFFGSQHIGKRIVFGVGCGLFAGGAIAQGAPAKLIATKTSNRLPECIYRKNK